MVFLQNSRLISVSGGWNASLYLSVPDAFERDFVLHRLILSAPVLGARVFLEEVLSLFS